MQRSPSRRRRQARRLTGLATAAIVTVGLVSLTPTAQGKAQPNPVDTQAKVHRAGGKALSGKSAAAPGQVVRNYLKAHGDSSATVGSLAATGPLSTSRGIGHLQMAQSVAGLRVHGSYAKAAFDSSGRLVDLVENVATVKGTPVKADVGPEAALRAAVASLYPRRSVDTTVTGRSGNTTAFARDGFYSAPNVEKVAVPTEGGGLAVGYEVETWTGASNELYVTLVDGDGNVVSHELRSAQDSYKIFPESPLASSQTTVNNPASATASPFGWLSGSQLTTDISGNNAHAYLDANNDDAPDAGGSAVKNSRFVATFDPTIQPTADPNRAVGVQNLFYLNNLIHDTLFKAGFNEAAGNFQAKNAGSVGKGADAVAAEAQDGGGTDNANFATPKDGKTPRMQMYLWSVPGMFEVNVTDGPSAGSYIGTNAEWGAPLTKAGVSGPLAAGIDNVAGAAPAGGAAGTITDGCETLPDLTGKIVVVDRGYCGFTVKAKNVQNAGGKGIIIAALDEHPVIMGGTDATVTITGEMVSKTDGATLRAAAGSNAILRLTQPAPIMSDGDLDTDIVWHEYGHGLTWRMIGQMDGPLAGAIGEGMSDVLAEIINDDPVVGEYSGSDPNGIRSHSYENYNRTYGSIAPAVADTEVHFDGEIYGAIGWDLWKQYKAAGLGQDKILADLVDGMNYTPARPAYEDMRDGILAGLSHTNPARSCMVWKAFAKYGVGVGASGAVQGKSVVISQSTAVPAACTP